VAEIAKEIGVDELVTQRARVPVARVDRFLGELHDRAGLDVPPRIDVVAHAGRRRAERLTFAVVVGVGMMIGFLARISTTNRRARSCCAGVSDNCGFASGPIGRYTWNHVYMTPISISRSIHFSDNRSSMFV